MTYLKLLGGKAMCFANGDKLIGITIISITSVCWASIIYFVSGHTTLFNLLHFEVLYVTSCCLDVCSKYILNQKEYRDENVKGSSNIFHL